MSITAPAKQELIKDFAQNEKDTGSADVQVAVLTTRIKNLTEHLKLHKKDFACELGLKKMVGRRKRLLAYIKSNDVARYEALIKKLGLRK